MISVRNVRLIAEIERPHGIPTVRFVYEHAHIIGFSPQAVKTLPYFGQSTARSLQLLPVLLAA
jgi:hypothetical protein